MELLPGAGYGKLPFDCFVLEKWNYSRPTSEDQQQWDELARSWLARGPAERYPYRETSILNMDLEAGDPGMPTAAQIARVLAPHQTALERNQGAKHGAYHSTPVCLRTCYAKNLDDAYREIALGLEDVTTQYHILDNEALYGHLQGEDWNRILLRLPSIPDVVFGDQEWFDFGDPPQQEWQRSGYEAYIKERTLVYLYDEQALREKLVKVMWLDLHGNCVWENKITPDYMFDLRGLLLQGSGLWEILGMTEDPEDWIRGALIRG